MTPDQARTLTAHLEAEANHDAAAAAATYVEDCYYNNAALGLVFDGRPMVEFQYAGSYELIRGMSAEYQWQHEGDAYVVQFGRIRGEVGVGDMFGVPAAGGAVDFPFTAVIEFAGTQMKGEHVFYDLDLFCTQAGIDVDALRSAVATVRA